MNYILLLSFPNNACHHVKVWRNIIKQKPFEKMLPEPLQKDSKILR